MPPTLVLAHAIVNLMRDASSFLAGLFARPLTEAVDKTEADLEPKVSELEPRLDKVAAILAKIGVQDAKKRLVVDRSGFKLTDPDGCCHAADAELLFDVSKIDPLIDAGIVPIVCDEPEGYSVVLVVSNSPSTDFEGEGGVSEVTEDSAEASAAEIDEASQRLLSEFYGVKLVD